MAYRMPSDQQRSGRGLAKVRIRRPMQPTLLMLKERTLLSTFTVTNTADSGTGSLR